MAGDEAKSPRNSEVVTVVVSTTALSLDMALAAVSAAHRGDAFDACRDLVEGVKFRLPIRKEQFFEGGEVEWVGLLIARGTP
ncbi:MAG: molybdenum cofactor biosynthesis protein MoaE [Arthrobacter sp.]|jgi:molybdopterin synthase catalytic subunit|nr:molybdenum cofactor biosynthesis protein MoaE [Arthrobacter sp.]